MFTGWHANIYELKGMTGNAKARLSSNETFLRFHFERQNKIKKHNFFKKKHAKLLKM